MLYETMKNIMVGVIRINTVYDFFQALIDEDRLLSRLEVLENQLHVYSKVSSKWNGH